jgi:predicted small secreted protein
MVPWGTVAPLLVVMVAVNVTGWLTTEGLGNDVRTMLTAPAPTLWTSAGETLPVKFVSPLV